MMPRSNLTRAIFGRKWLILVCVGIGLGLGHQYFQQQPPTYASTARILLERSAQLQNGVDQERREDPIDSQVYLIQQPAILQRAVDSGDLKDCKTLEGAVDPVPVIASHLQASRSRLSKDLIELRYICGDPSDCKVILTAIARAYQDWLSEKQQDSDAANQVRAIREVRQQLEEDLKASAAKLREFRDRTPLLVRDFNGVTIHEARLAEIDARRRMLIFERQQLATRLDHLQSALSQGVSREALLLLANADAGGDTPSGLAGNVETDPYMARVTELILERDRVLQEVGANHPSVKRIETSIQSLRDLLYQEAGESGGAAPKDLLEVHVESLNERIRTYDRELAKLDDMFEATSIEAKALARGQLEQQLLLDEGTQRQKLFDLMAERLGAAAPPKDQGTLIASVTEQPGDGVQVGPDFATIMGVGGAGGFLAAMALSFLLELANKNFRTPDEIIRHLGLPVMGHIPELAGGRDRTSASDSIVHQSIATFHWPMSRLAEAYRGVRAALSLGARGQVHRVLQITSPGPGDGKSTLAANLAVAVANSGKKCLLIDGDFRRPRVHELFGVPNHAGLSSVVRDGMDVVEAVQPSAVSNLEIMTVGPRIDDPAEILLSPRFPKLLAALCEQYDFVLIDTPPVLTAADSAAVAAHVDGVVLTIRINKRSRRQSRRACETLDLIGAKILGVVVNRAGVGFAAGSGTGYLSGTASGKHTHAYFWESDADR